MALSAPAALADIELPTVPPPQPQSATANVYVGESVDIPLSGVSRAGGGLQFLIRRRPAAGALSDIRMTGANTAVVTYTHSPHAGTGVDSFRYAVSSPGIGVSTPAEVTIRITQRPSIFIAPARADFADTPIGRTSTQTIELRNDGGGTIDGHLVVPPPWRIAEGDGGYSLGPGELTILTIEFAPSEAKLYSGKGEFSHAPGVEIGLGGGGYNPVEVVPREIRLETDGRTEVRTGGFLVRNISPDDRKLRIVAPPEVVVQDSLDSGAQSEAQVAMHTRAGFLGALDGIVKITGEGVSLEVPLHVMPAPARLAAKPLSLDFGAIDAGRAGRGKVTIHNAGGTAARLTVKMPAGITISPDPGSGRLDPDASKEYEIRLERPLAGSFSGDIVFETDGSAVSIPAVATIRPAWTTSEESGSPKASAPAQEEVAYSDVPPVMQLRVTRQTKTELDLAWGRTAPGVSGYVLYLRTIAFDSHGAPQFKYQRLDRVKVRFVRDQARATLSGLRPGESVTLLVVGYDENGLASQPSPAFTLATKPNPVFRFPWFWFSLLLLAALLVLIMRERRRRRIASDAEVARL